MKRKSSLLIVVILFFVSNSSYGTTASFQGLGDLPGGDFYSDARGVSADGTVVVGWSYSASGQYEAFRWENGTMIGLGDLPGGVFHSGALGASEDGSVIVGWSISASGFEAFRWENGEMVGLADLPGGNFSSCAYGVLADGSVVVGLSKPASGWWEAFRWENGEMVGLGDLPGGRFYSAASGASEDGSVIVGWSISASGFEAFRWEDLNGNGQVDPDEKLDNHPEFGLDDLPGGIFDSWASGVSANGSVVAGTGDVASGKEAFRWEDGVMVGLGDLPGGAFRSWAHGVSADGSVIVGSSVTDLGSEAFIWSEDNGMRNLKDLLVNECGLDLTDWSLSEAMGISADGLIIVGNGINPYGNTEGWIATIPEPASALLLGLGGLMLRRRTNR